MTLQDFLSKTRLVASTAADPIKYNRERSAIKGNWRLVREGISQNGSFFIYNNGKDCELRKRIELDQLEMEFPDEPIKDDKPAPIDNLLAGECKYFTEGFCNLENERDDLARKVRRLEEENEELRQKLNEIFKC